MPFFTLISNRLRNMISLKAFTCKKQAVYVHFLTLVHAVPLLDLEVSRFNDKSFNTLALSDVHGYTDEMALVHTGVIINSGVVLITALY